MRCAEAIRRHGGDALGIPCDVTDERQVEAMVTRAREVGGGVDVLVNNAGILGGQSVLEMELERWNRQLAVNLTGTFLCTKHVARLMIEHSTRGSIIVVVSTAGHQGQAGNIGYCTSKSGLLNFTRAAAMDLVRHGIRVNSLTPTATDVEEGDARAVDWGRPRPERRGRVLDSTPEGVGPGIERTAHHGQHHPVGRPPPRDRPRPFVLERGQRQFSSRSRLSYLKR